MGERQRDDRPAMVVMGRISGLYGVRGWVRIYSETDPREGLLGYSPWYLRRGEEWVERLPIAGRRHGKGVIAQLEGCLDRDQAAALIGSEIAVRRDQLPPTGANEFYWSDLEGLRVETLDGNELGRVDHLFETGANDVLVVQGERERLIPYLLGAVVRRIDLERGVIVVDWDPEF